MSELRKYMGGLNLSKIVNNDYYDEESWAIAYHTVISEYDGTDSYVLTRAKNCLEMAIKSQYYRILYKHCK